MTKDFFHAYVVGGHKEDARLCIDALLKKQNFSLENNPDYKRSEHVIFTIDHVRDLRAWQQLTPIGEKKIHVVYATFITQEAENALLKTLEEPVPKTHIILATPKPEMLLPTLLSRVRVLMPESTVHGGVHRIEQFLKMSVGDRMEFVKKLVEKSEDEYASAEVREKAVAFFDDLERYVEKNISTYDKKSVEKIESILKLKKYLFTPASSVRTIMETVALTM